VIDAVAPLWSIVQTGVPLRLKCGAAAAAGVPVQCGDRDHEERRS
jgi:hypothetical protein